MERSRDGESEEGMEDSPGRARCGASSIYLMEKLGKPAAWQNFPGRFEFPLGYRCGVSPGEGKGEPAVGAGIAPRLAKQLWSGWDGKRAGLRVGSREGYGQLGQTGEGESKGLKD